TSRKIPTPASKSTTPFLPLRGRSYFGSLSIRFQIHDFFNSHTFTSCVRPTYATSVTSNNSQNNGGSGTKPKNDASGENGRYAPIAMIRSAVTVICQLARD